MALLQRGLMLAVTAGVLAVPALTPKSPGTPASPPVMSAKGTVAPAPAMPSHTLSAYTPEQKEFYLEQAALDFIRPGLKVTIGAVTDIAPGKKPSVEVTITDDLNMPLDRTGGLTPGVVSMRFIPAVWDAEKFVYTNLLVAAATGFPTRDNTGTYVDLGPGKYKYTFAATLPQFDVNKPMTLFVGAVRATVDYFGKNYYQNVYKDFVPATNAAATTWAVTTQDACLNCHDSVTFVGTGNWPHGGNYRNIKTCALCHNDNTLPWTSTNPAIAASGGPRIWHQIHANKGYWSEELGHITYPRVLNDCDTCHDPKAAQGFTWYTYPTRNACGSCHDAINWTTGEGHAAGPQADDTKCATCHKPQGDTEYDASVKGAHQIDYESKQLKGLKAEIVSVEQAAPGKKPVVTFKLTENDGTVLDPKPFGSNLNIVMGGPAFDYATPNGTNGQPYRERADGAAFGGTNAVYTMTNAIPETAKGTWTFSIEARRTVTLNPGTPKQRSFTEGAMNPIKYVAVTGGTAEPRRAVANQALCNKCHGRLALHGGQRLNVEECIICHNPVASDVARRAAGDTPESIDMRRMVHRIHTGEELAQEYTVYGFGTAPPYPAHNYNEVTYPGDWRNCVACHINNTQNLPAKPGLLNVKTPRDYMTEQGPGTAARVGCHDARDYVAHAAINTATFGESCGTCHGTNSEWSVSQSPAR